MICIDKKKKITKKNSFCVKIIGAGLAGCEAAWQLAQRNINVQLFEMKPDKAAAAFSSPDYCELVCSNSFRSNDPHNAVGLLKEEMRRLGSLIIKSADEVRVPAGSALAVDRILFSKNITDKIRNHPNIIVTTQEVVSILEGKIIIATGPLTSDALASEISQLLPDKKYLSFYDAAAPIVTSDSIAMSNAYYASRYDKGSPDYINCPLDADEYNIFYDALINADVVPLKDFENNKVFEGCLPIEVLAKRGTDAIRFGPMKPVGLKDPKTGKTPYAVVQLRKDNISGSLYNLVGFQTNLKFSEQKRVFSLIPALREAVFSRYGVMHRNTYINSPVLLDRYYRYKTDLNIRFAGQITGVEGYVESAASGLLTGIETSHELLGLQPINFPSFTAIGALAMYISNNSVGDFQPMNINYGIIDPLNIKIKGKRDKNRMLSERSLEYIDKIKKDFKV